MPKIWEFGGGTNVFLTNDRRGKCFVNLFENSPFFFFLQTLFDLKQYSVQLWFKKIMQNFKLFKLFFFLSFMSLDGLLCSCMQDILSWEYSGWWEEEQWVPGRDFPEFEGALWVFT